MSHHIGDTNEMSETPRTQAVWELFATDTTLEPDVEFSTLARQLERELNAAQQRINRLEAALRRIANQDYRGNRSTESQIAEEALKEAR